MCATFLRRNYVFANGVWLLWLRVLTSRMLTQFALFWLTRVTATAYMTSHRPHLFSPSLSLVRFAALYNFLRVIYLLVHCFL